ncbi:MAG: serine/threonine protein kinase [Deltaproteobacteria bacterium]|nr:serine/threonine protein kinase [Deltaproteobacteria bacterium]
MTREKDAPAGRCPSTSAPTMDARTNPTEASPTTTVRTPADTLPSDAMPSTQRPLAGDLDAPSAVTTSRMPLHDAGFAARYVNRSVLGRGGMGEVRLCHDARIGRDIAMKVLRPGLESTSGTGARFVREARIQGQLEHPAIVPVYDLGLAPGDDAFFTMKRILGSTLEEVVEGLRAGNPEVERRFGRRRLLTAFSQVCLAVDFAHSRGVIHRDLKPGNVMLGDFGEVYVLDWGIARVRGSDDLADTPMDLARLRDTSSETRDGEVLGTPGYMAPEQVRQDPIDERADVYALGCILFELLTTQTLHDRHRSVAELLATTLRGSDARASVRAPSRDIPPELDSICVKATGTNREDRYPSARALHEAVERFLDGDRDLARRRELADESASRASRAALRAAGPDGKGSDRAEAIFEVGRALAFEPTHAEATRLLARLWDEAPKNPTTEALATVERASRKAKQLATRANTFAYVAWVAFAPIVLWMGVREPYWAIATLALLAASGIASMLALRSSRHADLLGWLAFVLGTMSLSLCGGILGPLVIVPTLAVGHTTGYALRPGRTGRLFVVAASCLAIVLPLVAELLGWLPSSIAVRDGAVVLLPRMLELQGPATVVLMTAAALGTIVVTGLFVGRIRDEIDEGEHRLRMQTWHLGQLVPAQAREAVAADLRRRRSG